MHFKGGNITFSQAYIHLNKNDRHHNRAQARVVRWLSNETDCRYALQMPNLLEFRSMNGDSSSSFEGNLISRADGAINRLRAKYGPEYNGNAVDAETGWSIADARIQQQQAFQLAMHCSQLAAQTTALLTGLIFRRY